MEHGPPDLVHHGGGACANLLSGFENQTRVGDDRVSFSIQTKSSRSTDYFSHPTTLESTVACTTYGCPLDDGQLRGMAAGTRASEQFGDTRVVLAKLSCVSVEGSHTARRDLFSIS